PRRGFPKDRRVHFPSAPPPAAEVPLGPTAWSWAPLRTYRCRALSYASIASGAGSGRGEGTGPAARSAAGAPFGPCVRRWLPAGLGDARQLALVRHLAEADAAQAELPEHGARTAAARATSIPANSELRLPVRLGDQCLLSHTRSLRLP